MRVLGGVGRGNPAVPWAVVGIVIVPFLLRPVGESSALLLVEGLKGLDWFNVGGTCVGLSEFNLRLSGVLA